MKKSEYARMAEHEANYWWHLGRLRIIQTYIKKAVGRKKDAKILNVGCGTGGTIDMLESFGEVDNVDISDDAIKFMKKHGYHRITKVDDIELPFKDKSYDIVGAFDVLEHIEDHVGALKEWSRVLKDDGAVVLTVPAYQWLWSDHDVSLYHKRRYTTKLLAKAADEAGLRPLKKSYAVVFSLPMVVGFRTLNKLLGRKTDSETSYVDVPEWVNKTFTKLLYAEAGLHKHVAFPAGTSVVAILKKK
jgi:ubiquinone/menaquinone biosynthesis C-methylase UbiE